MPLGSIMNLARTLWVPRDLALAARPIAEGKLLAIDMGRVGERFFLEAAGVGLDAGLFGPFERPAEAARTPKGSRWAARCARGWSRSAHRASVLALLYLACARIGVRPLARADSLARAEAEAT